jgi:SAM-dependent MidA family methyltransferase
MVEGRRIIAHAHRAHNRRSDEERYDSGDRCHIQPTEGGGGAGGRGAGTGRERGDRTGSSVVIHCKDRRHSPPAERPRYDPNMSHSPLDSFASLTDSAPLVAELRRRIEHDGPITFRDFMEAALYHPKWGYYRTTPQATTAHGDYVTSPEVHPVFGALVARQLLQLWERLGRPRAFDVVEHGAGTGRLARDITTSATSADSAFSQTLRYTIIEPIEQLRAEQAATLSDGASGATVTWAEAAPTGITGVVLTNELLDALPVHRVVRQDAELLEVYVGLDANGRFVDQLAQPSTPEIGSYFEALGVLPGIGAYAEVNLDAPCWIAAAAASLDRGYLLTFDYGYEAADLYAPWRRDGTLLCFYKQSASSDPYQRIGKQDITASVDLTTLRRAAEAAGVATLGATDQSMFLYRLGIGESLAKIRRERPSEMEEYFARRNVVVDLIDPARLGRIKVLLHGKGVPGEQYGGFHDD